MHPPGLQRFALTVDRPASAPRADGLRRAYYGPSHGRNAVHVFSIRGGTTIAACYRMRRILGFLAGVLVGQWLVFGGGPPPAPPPTPPPPPPGGPGHSPAVRALRPAGGPPPGERQAASPPRPAPGA